MPNEGQPQTRLIGRQHGAWTLDVTHKSLPSNSLEALAGDRAGQYSIRINNQWRKRVGIIPNRPTRRGRCASNIPLAYEWFSNKTG